MARRTIQIMQEVQGLLDTQIRMTMSGGVTCLTGSQWREYNKRETQIAALLRELDAENSSAIQRKMPCAEMDIGRHPTRRTS